MRVALFATCLVDLFRPQVGFAAARLLEAGGATVVVPDGQTCCGQPAYNSGDRSDARALARQTVAALAGFEAVVVPSGSCAGMIGRHYPELLADDGPEWRARAEAVAARTWELTAFCTEQQGLAEPPGSWTGTATYHDSCSCLREVGVRQAPRALLAGVDGLELAELGDSETCCGFGGTFAVKYPEISARMVADKAARITETGADLVVACDLGCLLNIAGYLRRQGSNVAARHIAEVLANGPTAAPIGEADREAG